MAEPQAINSEEELQQWVREQFQHANKHLAENGVLFESVNTEECRYLAPFVAVWKIKSTDGKQWWVVSGDLPTNYMSVSAAKTAREAIRHFSFAWQMKADDLIAKHANDPMQQEFANLLINKAENLYRVQEDDSLWQDQP